MTTYLGSGEDKFRCIRSASGCAGYAVATRRNLYRSSDHQHKVTMQAPANELVPNFDTRAKQMVVFSKVRSLRGAGRSHVAASRFRPPELEHISADPVRSSFLEARRLRRSAYVWEEGPSKYAGEQPATSRLPLASRVATSPLPRILPTTIAASNPPSKRSIGCQSARDVR
jgi:hypothetical protein